MPRSFKFRLDKVLDYRTQLEDQAKLALAEAKRAYDEQAGVLAVLEESLFMHEASARVNDETTANDMWLWRTYKKRLEEDIDEAHVILKNLQSSMDERRRNALKRSQERKMLEQLKDKKKVTFTQEEHLKEQKEFDESATLRYRPGDI
jgi:flagellar FliJ protein